MSDLNLDNLRKNKTEILKAEVGALLFNLGKTHIGFWEEKDNIVYFDIDKEEFKKLYGYKTFSSYRDYYKVLNNKFNSRSPFEIDLNSINEELKDFFNNTEINFLFKNRKNLKLIDVIKGDAGNNTFIKKIMFRGCENVNSGIDKGAPKKQLNDLHIVNAFGTTKEEITNSKKGIMNVKRYDETRIIFLTNLWEKICSLGKVNVDVFEIRRYIFSEVEKWYSHLLSDSRFPANDVTLWDQAYITASLFKASMAALCLDDEKYSEYINNLRKIKWSVLGIQYDKLGLAEKALNPSFIDWYRKETDKVDKKLKKIIEEDFALGNEIYRDETGIYFIVPENICGEKVGDNIEIYKLNRKLNKVQKQILECFKSFNGEVFPAIFVTEPSRGTMNIAYLLKNAQENFLKPVYPKGNFIEEYFGKIVDKKDFEVVCDVCKVRLADKDADKDLNLCEICKAREKENRRTKLNDIFKETIWTDELQDKNGRIALVTIKFELDEWLNGNMLHTMLNNDTETVNGKHWSEVLSNMEEMLFLMKETYILPSNNFDGKKNYRLKKYKEFAEGEAVNLIKGFLSYFDEKGVKNLYINTVDFIKETPSKDKRIKVFQTFDNFFYPFLKERLPDDICSNYIKRDDDYKLNNIKQRFIQKGKSLKKEIKKDWGNSPCLVAKGIFSFAYVTEQINSILLERSIGDEWEKFLKEEEQLGDRIDFENREIKWNKLEKKDIKFLARIILQFLIRKNPSPARFRRIWKTTEEFFINIESHMMDILEVPYWRNIRIKWNKAINKEKQKGREFTYQGINFISDHAGNLYLISSIEKAIPVLTTKLSDKSISIQEIYTKILDKEGDWIKTNIEIRDVKDNSKCKVNLKKPKYISYKPYLSIINPTPISWQSIIPAEYVPKLIQKVQYKYDKEFRYVKGKLPLHIGVVFQDYKKPLYIGIKSLRNIRRDLDSWDNISKDITGKKLRQMSQEAINRGNSGCENRTEVKKHYSLYPLKNSGKGDYNFYIRPENNLVGLKSVDKANEDEKYVIYPNTIDFEYLDVNTRRNDIYYQKKRDKGGFKRVEVYKQNRPYTWEEWRASDKFYNYFRANENKTKLQAIVNLIYAKLSDWQDNNSIKIFMLSAFINIFNLKDDNLKDHFAQIFGKNTWKEFENISDQSFRKGLYKFLDLYDFWHNGLKEL